MQPAARRCLARRLAAPQHHHHHHHQRRGFCRSAPCLTAAHAPAAPAPSGLAHLASRKLLSVAGPDASKFLQGLMTANFFPGPSPRGTLPPLRTDLGFYSAFLAAQGRVLFDAFVYRDVRAAAETADGDAWLVEVDAEQADRVRAYIARYRLRAKLEVRVLEDGEAEVWHAWGGDDDSGSSEIPASSADPKTHLAIRDPRAPPLGHRLLIFPRSSAPHTVVPPSHLPFPLPALVGEDAYRLHRYLAGVPEGQAELLRDAALPHESNMDAQAGRDGLGTLDFRKGCYTGQELTIRTQHRGVVRKRVLPCLLYPSSSAGGAAEQQQKPTRDETELAGLYRPSLGEDVLGGGDAAARVPCGAGIDRVGRPGKAVGKWLRGVGNVGLAVCRLEAMTDVRLPGELGGSTGFKVEDEFVVGLGEGGAEGKVKVRAFVPGWLRGYLEGQREGKGNEH